MIAFPDQGGTHATLDKKTEGGPHLLDPTNPITATGAAGAINAVAVPLYNYAGVFPLYAWIILSILFAILTFSSPVYKGHKIVIRTIYFILNSLIIFSVSASLGGAALNTKVDIVKSESSKNLEFEKKIIN